MENEVKTEQPATETKETPVAEKPQETPANAPAVDNTKTIEQEAKDSAILEENAKLKAFRDNAVLKQNGFKEEYNAWIQMIAEKDGKSFDNADEINAYLKDAKFNVFKPHSFNETANVQPKEEQTETQGKKPKTQDEIDNTYIYVPGLDTKK